MWSLLYKHRVWRTSLHMWGDVQNLARVEKCVAQHEENLSMHAENVALQTQHFIPTCGMGFYIYTI